VTRPPVIARGRRLRVSVDVDVLASVRTELAAATLAGASVEVLGHLSPQVYRVHQASVLDVTDGTVVARFLADGREYVRVDPQTGEVVP
jgi:hypothetical protein